MIPNLCRQDPKRVSGVTISDTTQVVQSTIKLVSEPKSNGNQNHSGKEPKTVEQARRGMPVPFTIHTHAALDPLTTPDCG